MKRTLALAGMLASFAIALSAAVWDGSAVSGGQGDFPDDGLYGACNSFPRDTSVTVTNLENGKTVTVTITRSVDNPGVFIALSPKAAAALGMQSGASARIRAVALTASQAETSLPPARAGETADPDYNPKVYVDRERAAVAAAQGSAQAKAAETPVEAPVAAQPAAPAASVVQTPPTAAEVPAAAPVPAEAAPATSPDQGASVIAKSEEPEKAAPSPQPPLAEPKPTSAAKTEVAKLPADKLPIPESSPSYPGSPKPAPLSPSLPSPDSLPLPAQASPVPRASYIAQAPELLSADAPQPRRAAALKITAPDPSLPSEKAPAVAAASPTKADKASVVDLARPGASAAAKAAASAKALSLAEPSSPDFAPEELPETVLSRVTAPTRVEINPKLAEANPAAAPAPEAGPEALALGKPDYLKPSSQAELAEAVPSEPAAGSGPEALALEKPSYAGEVEKAALAEASVVSPLASYASESPAKAAGEGASADLAEAELPGAPEALADRKKAAAGEGLAELQVPDLPKAYESLTLEGPKAGASSKEALAGLDEPQATTPAAVGTGPTILADRRAGPAGAAAASLNDPSVPSPESLAGDKPKAAPPARALSSLAEPEPSAEAAPAAAEVPDNGTALALERPRQAAAAVSKAELASPAVPQPRESIAPAHPAASAAVEETVTLEPAAPKPPVAVAPASTAPAAAQPAAPAEVTTAPAPSAAPASVATVKSVPPAGVLQAPASVPLIKGLAKGSYYVQIGVYGTNEALQAAVAGFKSTYPLAVESVKTKKGAAAYRLFVGPLSRDESGVVLTRIRSLGYKDAYIRQGS